MSWSEVPLGEVVTLHYGKALPRQERDPTGDVPLYGANGIKEYSVQSLVTGPSLVVGRKGSAGEVTRAEGPFWPLDVTFYTEHDQERLNLDFLEYALGMLDLPSLAKGVKPGINRNEVYALPLPLPPLDEQERIVAVLDQSFAALDSARANAEANLADAEELFSLSLDRAFQDLVEHGEQTLSELITIAHGFAFKSADFSDVDDENLPIVLTPGNYAENATLYFRSGKTRRLTSNPPPEFVFDKGELTIVMTDLSSKMKILGKPAFIDREGLLHNQRIGRVRFVDESLLPRFLFYFMRTGSYLGTIRETATGTMVRHTAPKRILSCRIPLPSIEVQKQVVERVSGIEARCELVSKSYSATISELEGLRQSILQKAFDGELI